MTDLTVARVFWTAACSCGWTVSAPNDLDSCLFQVRTHLAVFHRDVPHATRMTIDGAVSTRLVAPDVPAPEATEGIVSTPADTRRVARPDARTA